MRKITLLAIVMIFIALLAVSCQKETPYQDGDRTVVPFSLKAVVTKASFTGNPATYGFKSGDKLAVSSTVRPDISGLLSYDGSENEWSGPVSYRTIEGEPAGSTAIKVTLVHADNDDQSTYANGIAYEVGGGATSLLQTAVEKYSLFTADITFGSNEAHLQQQACFLDATVTFNFENGNFDLAGQTSVDVIVNNSLTVSGRAVLAQVGQTNSYSTNFVIAMPGGTTLTDESVIQICDRNVRMVNADKTLAANNKYTVSREVNFEPQLGDPFWSDGTYGRIAHDPGVEITGIIVFVNNYEDSDDSDLAEEARALTEKASGFGHALVMSLKNAGTPGTGIRWTNTSGSNALSGTAITSPSEILGINNVSGYANTTTLVANAANTAAVTAADYRPGDDMKNKGTSGWFLPAIGQWVYSISIRGFGGADVAENWLINQSSNKWLEKGQLSNLVLVKDNGDAADNLLVKSLNDRMQILSDQFGCSYDSFGMTAPNGNYGDNYWSSSEYDAANAIRMNFGSVESYGGKKWASIKTNYLSKQSTSAWEPKGFFIMKVRPFLAF
ncbi:MAG: hypothetical protein IKX45_06310 [Bacteroidales bacterium]|nr:hypothetical protein [Bacteroidales bacterium]